MVREYTRKRKDRYSKETLIEALMCIKEDNIKIYAASKKFGIPKSTLYRQYKKFIEAGGDLESAYLLRNCGGSPILGISEENILAKVIGDMRDKGIQVTAREIRRICFEYCDANKIPNQFSPYQRMASADWYYGFLKRYPSLRLPRRSDSSSANTGSSSATSTALQSK